MPSLCGPLMGQSNIFSDVFLFKERLEGYESQKTSKTPLIPNNNYSDRISLFGVGWLLGENSCCFTVSDLLQNLYNPRNS